MVKNMEFVPADAEQGLGEPEGRRRVHHRLGITSIITSYCNDA
ncbi:protein of unknown function [Kyrpidia spormannii]|nr:protein of unknown function [Kyrpidia spormannii]